MGEGGKGDGGRLRLRQIIYKDRCALLHGDDCIFA
jgi:hypothetical protein